MKDFLKQALQSTLLIWSSLTIEIIAVSILYISFVAAKVPENASLLISFFTLLVLIILSLLIFPQSILQLRQQNTTSLSKKRRAERRLTWQDQATIIEQLAQSVEQLTQSIQRFGISKLSPESINNLTDSLAKIQHDEHDNTRNMLNYFERQSSDANLQVSSQLANLEKVFTQLTASQTRQLEEIKQLIEGLSRYQKSLDTLIAGAVVQNSAIQLTKLFNETRDDFRNSQQQIASTLEYSQQQVAQVITDAANKMETTARDTNLIARELAHQMTPNNFQSMMSQMMRTTSLMNQSFSVLNQNLLETTQILHQTASELSRIAPVRSSIIGRLFSRRGTRSKA